MSVTAKRSATQRLARQSKPNKSELLSTTAAVPSCQHGDGDAAGESAEQHASKSSAPKPKPTRFASTATRLPTSPHHRQGDRGSSEDDAASRLPVFVRFHDLRAAGIVSNWPQLYNLIDDYGFPAGVMLSPNCRVWNVEDVQSWLVSRPTERKIIPPRKQKAEIHA
jgi:hypothetical protein